MKIKLLTLKHLIKITFILLLMFLFVAYPSVCINGAKNGLMTVSCSVIPAIFPFMVMAKYYINCNNIENKIFTTFGKLVNLPPAGIEAILLSSLCGYPTGAIILKDFVKKKDYQQN